MKLGIVGSRKLDDYSIVEEAIKEHYGNSVSFIVSGGAVGADKLGVLYAQIHNIPYFEHIPNTTKYPNFSIAAKERNTLIVDDADAILAFWNGKSSGTKDSIEKAEASNTPITIIKI